MKVDFIMYLKLYQKRHIYGESNRITRLRGALKGQIPGHLKFESLNRAKEH